MLSSLLRGIALTGIPDHVDTIFNPRLRYLAEVTNVEINAALIDSLDLVPLSSRFPVTERMRLLQLAGLDSGAVERVDVFRHEQRLTQVSMVSRVIEVVLSTVVTKWLREGEYTEGELYDVLIKNGKDIREFLELVRGIIMAVNDYSVEGVMKAVRRQLREIVGHHNRIKSDNGMTRKIQIILNHSGTDILAVLGIQDSRIHLVFYSGETTKLNRIARDTVWADLKRNSVKITPHLVGELFRILHDGFRKLPRTNDLRSPLKITETVTVHAIDFFPGFTVNEAELFPAVNSMWSDIDDIVLQALRSPR